MYGKGGGGIKMQTQDFTKTEKRYKEMMEDECQACEAEKEPVENPTNVMKRDPRKNRMKNKPCPCSSGKKFKNCCWSKFSPKNLQKKVSDIIAERIDSE